VHCSIKDRRCHVGGTEIEVGHTLAVFTEAGRPIRFEISDAVSDGSTSMIELQVRFVVPHESVGLVKNGARAHRDSLLGDRVPALVAIEGARQAPARVDVPSGAAGEWAVEVTETMSTLDATVRVRADATSEGLQYRGRALRAGAPFVFEHDRYVLRGWIRSLTVLPESRK
jgi:hypothetical protein